MIDTGSRLQMERMGFATKLLHADDSHHSDLEVSPPISVSTTYRQREGDTDDKYE